MNIKETIEAIIANWFAWIALVVFVVLVIMSVRVEEIAGPDPWLTEWTAFTAKYAALAVAVHKVWKLGDATVAWILKKT